jgi:hypothetical protein
MTDFLGKKLEVGQRVVWPGRKGNTMYQSVGTVRAVLPDHIKVERESGYVAKLTNLTGVVVIGGVE